MKRKLNQLVATGLISFALLSLGCQKNELIESSSTQTATELSAANGRITTRPFSDYLSAQGTTAGVVPPVPDFIGSSAPQNKAKTIYRYLSVDYNGTSAEYLNDNYKLGIPTTVSGTIKERETNDGRAIVTITVHTENALTFAFTGSAIPDWVNDPLDFGYRPQDLIDDPSLEPALGSIDLTITFYNPKPGATIPDLIELFTIRFFDVINTTIKSKSTGTFHEISGFDEGTQGTVDNHQVGLWHLLFKGSGKNLPTKDLYPQEKIRYSAN